MKDRKFSAPNLFVLLCVCFPILASYVSPIPGVDFGTFLVLVFTPYLLSARNLKFSLPIPLTVVLIYTCLCTVMALLGTEFFSSPSSIITRTGRFVFLIVLLIGCGVPSFYDENKYIRFLEKVSIIVALYAIIQYLAYSMAGVRLPNTFFAIRSVPQRVFEDIVFEYRPSSLLLEPSHASYFLTPYLCLTLFKKELIKERLIMAKAFLVTAAILSTTSGQGLIIVAVCWCIWLFREFKNLSFGKILIVVIFGFLLLSRIDLSYTVDRITTTDETNAIDSRMGGYNLISRMDVSDLIFGQGFGNYDETIFFASYADIIFCTGYIGLILVVMMFLFFLLKGDFFKRVLILCFLILMSGSGIYSATFVCFVFPLIVSKNKSVYIAIPLSRAKCIKRAKGPLK